MAETEIDKMDRVLETVDSVDKEDLKDYFYNPFAKRWFKRHKFTKEDITKKRTVKATRNITMGQKIRHYMTEGLACSNCKWHCILFDNNTTTCYKKGLLVELRKLGSTEHPVEWIDFMMETIMEMWLELKKNYNDPTGFIKFKKMEGFIDKVSELYKLKFGEKYQIAQVSTIMTPDQFQKMYQAAEEHIKQAEGKVEENDDTGLD